MWISKESGLTIGPFWNSFIRQQHILITINVNVIVELLKMLRRKVSKEDCQKVADVCRKVITISNKTPTDYPIQDSIIFGTE